MNECEIDYDENIDDADIDNYDNYM